MEKQTNRFIKQSRKLLLDECVFFRTKENSSFFEWNVFHKQIYLRYKKETDGFKISLKEFKMLVLTNLFVFKC